MSQILVPPLEAVAADMIAAPRAARRSWLSSTAGRSLLAIVDQGVVSGTRFATTVLLGHAAGPGELGSYTLAFSLLLLVTSAQEALVTLPYTIYSSRLSAGQQRTFAGSVLAHWAILSTLGAAAVDIAALALAGGGELTVLSRVLGVLAVTLPVVCLVEFARRYLLAHFAVSRALALDATVAAIQIGGMAWLAASGRLTAVTAFAAIGCGALVAGAVWLAVSRGQFALRRASVRRDAIGNWRFGRWVLLSQVTLVARNNVVAWLLAFMLNPAATGILAACEMVMTLANPLLLAMSNVLTPLASRALVHEGPSRVRRIVAQSTLLLGAVTAIMSAGFVVLADRILVPLYGEAFAGHGQTVLLLSLAVLAEAIGIAPGNGLWALERPNFNFAASLLGLAVTVFASLALVPSWGVAGAAAGMLAGRLASAIVQLTAFAVVSSRPAGEVAP